MECSGAFDSYSADGYAIRCNQRERRTSRSHQHLHIAVHWELEQIHCSVSIHHMYVCVSVAQISATTDSVNRHERHAVGDLFKFNKARWIVGRCIVIFFPSVFSVILFRVCFMCSRVSVHAAHHRLFGDVHQVLDVVILVLLKGREQHIQHHLSLSPHHLPLRLLLLLILHLRVTLHITSRNITNVNIKRQFKYPNIINYYAVCSDTFLSEGSSINVFQQFELQCTAFPSLENRNIH